MQEDDQLLNWRKLVSGGFTDVGSDRRDNLTISAGNNIIVEHVIVIDAFLGRCSWHVLPGGDPGEDPGHAGVTRVRVRASR